MKKYLFGFVIACSVMTLAWAQVTARPGKDTTAPVQKPAAPTVTPRPAVQSYKPDLATGRAPTAEEVAAAEQAAVANPDEFSVVRKLGKTYFYRFFGAGEKDLAPKSRATLTLALKLKPDDAETLAFIGTIDRLTGREQEGIELMAKARKLDPANIGVLGLISGFGDVSAMEELRKMPEFAGMSDHGRQRVLLGLGKDRAGNRQPKEARALFSEGLAINENTREARMLRTELENLK